MRQTGFAQPGMRRHGLAHLENMGDEIVLLDGHGGYREQSRRVEAAGKKCISVLEEPHRPGILVPSMQRTPRAALATAVDLHPLARIYFAGFHHRRKEDCLSHATTGNRRTLRAVQSRE